ncbi:MAG: Ig-like domain-containing protein [Deltaproteobacteria bacterium]|nr:Ig-like domain-containing protein [Deltaproteobacteria bacterium]
MRLILALAIATFGGCLDFSAPLFSQGAPPPPEIVATLPHDGEENVDTSSALTIVFTRPMDRDALLVLASPAIALGSPIWDLDDTRVAFFPTQVLDGATRYAVSIDGAAVGGGPLAPAAIIFTTAAATVMSQGPAPPVVSATNPLNDAGGVALQPSISVTFSRPMASATLALNPAVNLDAPEWNTAMTVMTFPPPTAPLLANQSYVATITGLSDDGLDLAATSFTFTTLTPPDVTAPYIQLRSPEASTTQIPTGVDVVVGFSEPMNTASVTMSVTINGSGTPIACTPAFDASHKVLTCDPTSSLPPSTQINVEILPGATDAHGLAMAATPPHHFITGVADDVMQPSITLVTPPTGTVNVYPNAVSLVFHFDEAMKPTATEASLTVNDGSVNLAGTTSWNSPANDTLTWTPTSAPAWGKMLTWTFKVDAADRAHSATDPSTNLLTGTNTGSVRIRQQRSVVILATGTWDGHLGSDGGGPYQYPQLYVGDWDTNVGMRAFFTFDLGQILTAPGGPTGAFDEARKDAVTFSNVALKMYMINCLTNGANTLVGDLGSMFFESVDYGPGIGVFDWATAVDETSECPAVVCSIAPTYDLRYNTFNAHDTSPGYHTIGVTSVLGTNYNVAPKVRYDWIHRNDLARNLRSQWRIRYNTVTDNNEDFDYCRWYSGAVTGTFALLQKPRLEVTFEFP